MDVNHIDLRLHLLHKFKWRLIRFLPHGEQTDILLYVGHDALLDVVMLVEGTPD
jgi:hypothetical protein